jgi:single-stranded-DNA-specific exonuclease
LHQELQVLEPFGSGNPQMKFLLKNVNVYEARAFGLSGTHITCKLQQNGYKLKCNSFGNAVKNPCDILINNPKNVSILGSMSLSFWNGREYFEFLAEDVMNEK